MRKSSRLLSGFLCVILLFLSVFAQSASAVTQGRITGSSVNMRNKATTAGSSVVATLPLGAVVTINSTVTGQQAEKNGTTTWYNVTYGGKTGYVYGKYVEKITAAATNPDFESNLKKFPTSYVSALRAIHNVYPNWIFIADTVGVSLDTAIDYEYSAKSLTATKKWVELTFGTQWRDPRVDINNTSHIRESRWTFASREAIAYFMDPRNALTVETTSAAYPNIFTFLQQSYDVSTQTEAGLKTVVSGTFLANGYNGDTNAYIGDIMEAARESGVSPYVIASTIIIEQGSKGTSSLISGKYAGYEGYYNFFNYGASGDNVIKNGLEYAKSKGWNSRRAAIIGGAKKYESGYLNIGQDTYYYMDFNVKKSGTHQYATNLYDQCIKAAGMRKVAISNKNAYLTFKIPVYSSMPASAYTAPTVAEYQAAVNASATQTQPAQTTARKKGDVNNDGSVTVIDFAMVRMHLLGVRTLTAAEVSGADTNGDGKVNVSDFAMIRMYLLGLIAL